MTDLELIDKWCDECLYFIAPLLFKTIQERGLEEIVNYLPKNREEAKAVARARMRKLGKYTGDEEIDKISGQIGRLEFLRNKLSKLNMADVHQTFPILEEMQEISIFVRDYFKK